MPVRGCGKAPLFTPGSDTTRPFGSGDLTEIDTGEGKLYLATVIDLLSRRLLGYAMAEQHDADLVVASLNMAAATRGGDVRGVIMHTDRGSEGGFKRACRTLGVIQSTGRVGSCFDCEDDQVPLRAVA